METGLNMEDQQSEAKQNFHLRDFDGPLDLLLFLIKKAEINIYEIPIADITKQYLEYLEYSTKVDLENITEFYVMAATLLYIKSRMLLPVEIDLDDELEDPRRELIERLIDYQKFKKLSELMSDKEHEAEWLIERKKKQRPLPFEDDGDLWEQIEVWDLLKTFSSIMSSLSAERIIDLYEEVSINEKISLIHELLEARGEFMFTDLIVKHTSVMEIVCAFLAILEAVKSKKIQVFQNRLFGDILVRARTQRQEDETGEGNGSDRSDSVS